MPSSGKSNEWPARVSVDGREPLRAWFLSRTEYRKRRKEIANTPGAAWIAPEHARMAEKMKRDRNGILILPEPKAIREQNAAEYRKRIHREEVTRGGI